MGSPIQKLIMDGDVQRKQLLRLLSDSDHGLCLTVRQSVAVLSVGLQWPSTVAVCKPLSGQHFLRP